MPTWLSQKTLKISSLAVVAVFCLLGIFFRFYIITANEFFIYDAGFYLNLERDYLRFISDHFPRTLYDFWRALYLCLCLALKEGKALWFLISNLRVFVGAEHLWFFPRVVAALAGTAVLFVVYHFARRLFNSRLVAGLSVMTLAVLPGHVFYSRLGLQETLCTLFFLTGFFFYLFPSKLGIRTFISSVFLTLAYFSNYRLIIIPALVLFCEVYTSLSLKKTPDWRKYMWNTLIFLLLIFLIGNINHAQNTIVTFAWMFHQAGLAEGTFDPLNLLSYPYYLFKLENAFFAILFFASVYFMVKRQWLKSFPFALTILGMVIFSFTADKAARYICVMMPFMVMAVAGMVDFLLCEIKSLTLRRVVVVFTVLMLSTMVVQSFEVAWFKSDYQSSIEYVKNIDPQAKVMSTQVWVQNLYMDPHDIIECPLYFPLFVSKYNGGFKYLIVDPQMYISWIETNRRFGPAMDNYLQFIVSRGRPIKTFSHFNAKMLERFVFEHNENLRRSIAFLKSDTGDLGVLRVYDARDCITLIAFAMSVQAKRDRR